MSDSTYFVVDWFDSLTDRFKVSIARFIDDLHAEAKGQRLTAAFLKTDHFLQWWSLCQRLTAAFWNFRSFLYWLIQISIVRFIDDLHSEQARSKIDSWILKLQINFRSGWLQVSAFHICICCLDGCVERCVRTEAFVLSNLICSAIFFFLKPCCLELVAKAGHRSSRLRVNCLLSNLELVLDKASRRSRSLLKRKLLRLIQTGRSSLWFNLLFQRCLEQRFLIRLRAFAKQWTARTAQRWEKRSFCMAIFGTPTKMSRIFLDATEWATKRCHLFMMSRITFPFEPLLLSVWIAPRGAKVRKNPPTRVGVHSNSYSVESSEDDTHKSRSVALIPLSLCSSQVYRTDMSSMFHVKPVIGIT